MNILNIYPQFQEHLYKPLYEHIYEGRIVSRSCPLRCHACARKGVRERVRNGVRTLFHEDARKRFQAQDHILENIVYIIYYIHIYSFYTMYNVLL